jgi:predicted transcriptional regulator
MKQDKKNKSCLLKVTKRRKEKTQINKIREDKENIRTDYNEIQKIIQEYFQISYPRKMEKKEKNEKFVNIHTTKIEPRGHKQP